MASLPSTLGPLVIHDPLKYFIEAFHNVSGQLALLTGQQDAKADEQRNDNDLKHGGIHQRRNGIGGEDGNDGVHNALTLRWRIFEAGGGQWSKQMQSLRSAGQNQSQCNGEGGGAHIVYNGLAAHRADLFDISHGDNTGGNGEQHDGNDDEFQQVQEDGAEGLDVAVGNISTVGHSHQD